MKTNIATNLDNLKLYVGLNSLSLFFHLLFATGEVIGADDQKKLTAFEKIGLDEYLTHRLKFERELIDVKVSSTGERQVPVRTVHDPVCTVI